MIDGVIDSLRKNGVRLSLCDGQLKYTAPKGVMTPDLTETLAKHKSDLISTLDLDMQKRKFLSTPIDASACGPPLPLTLSQAGMWFQHNFQLARGGIGTIFNLSVAMRLLGKLDVEVFHNAVARIAENHDILRSSFVATEGQPQQTVAHNLKLHRPATASVTDADMDEAVRECSQQIFDLERGPLWRYELLAISPQEYVFVLTIHHMIADGISISVLLEEISAHYCFELGKSRDPVSAPPLQYTHFARRHRKMMEQPWFERDLEYWQNQLQGAPQSLDFPGNSQRPRVFSGSGNRITFSIRKSTLGKLRAFKTSHNSTVFMTLFALFNVLLTAYTKQDDILVGVPVSGRFFPRTEKLIGLFISTLAIRTQVDGRHSFLELLEQVKSTVADAISHQYVPLPTLIRKTCSARNPAHAPLVQAEFTYQQSLLASLELPGITVQKIEQERNTVHNDLVVSLFERQDQLIGEFAYCHDVIPGDDVRMLVEKFITFIDIVLARPATSLDGLLQTCDC